MAAGTCGSQPWRSPSRPRQRLRAQAIEPVVETAKRIAARGGDAIVLIDGLDGLPPHSARKLLAAARKLTEGGSLTVIATAAEPLGGETTVIALDAVRATPASCRRLTSSAAAP